MDKENNRGVTSISIKGFKSLARECSIEIRPLTILAGVNSSGKSSIIQPLLMMKQTLDESYDPGDIKINGPNVGFTKIDQFLSQKGDRESINVTINAENEKSIALLFKRVQNKGIKLVESIYKDGEMKIILRPNRSQEDILSLNPYLKEALDNFPLKGRVQIRYQLKVERDRCFLEPILSLSFDEFKKQFLGIGPFMQNTETFKRLIREIIHVPALRGNPQRDYDISATGPVFPGTFEKYVASIINEWQIDEDTRLKRLNAWLRKLRLTKTVYTKPIDDTRVEISVDRLPVTEDDSLEKIKDQVSIADVGYGVSQTLPVLVALAVAKPGQIVYIEQPEIHLHPRAQIAMAEILAESAKLGIKVIAETHSALLLRGIQTIVANGNIIRPENVKLHWFERGVDDGITRINSADLNEAGSFGNWPVDFSDVLMEAESGYIQAAEPHLGID